MSERDLPCVTDQEVEANGNDHIDSHVVGHIDIVVFEEKGKEGKKGDEDEKPEEGDSRTEELDVLIIVPFHVHGRFLRLGTPERG
jgi:hypothetical protein